jgi:hypothetical protein
MVHPSLEEISAQLDSSDSRDRMWLSPPCVVSHLLMLCPDKKVLNDEILQIRSMAVFALALNIRTNVIQSWWVCSTIRTTAFALMQLRALATCAIQEP